MARSRVAAFIGKEVREILPPTFFFAVGFCLIELTTQLILDNYLVRFANFMVAIGAALVVGKAVLLANLLSYMRRFGTAPLIRPILFKSIFYALVVLLVRFLEKVIEYWIAAGRIAGIAPYRLAHFSWDRLPRSRYGFLFCFFCTPPPQSWVPGLVKACSRECCSAANK